MSTADPDGTVADWWSTSIIEMFPGVVNLRGVPVQDLIGRTDLVSTIWMMVRGGLPTSQESHLLEAAMVASVDHGPQAPSIAIARMASTCGVGLNNAMASGINALGDVHGGAGQQCVEMLQAVVGLVDDGTPVDEAARSVVAATRRRTRYLPGFGHRFHPVDPRRGPLLGLVERARAEGTVEGRHLDAALAIEADLNEGRTRPIPMNIDGATAIIYAELGFEPALARGLFVLSRSVGILAHAYEESQSGRRNKGPVPPSVLPTFTGPTPTASTRSSERGLP